MTREHEIYDADGNLLGNISLSDMQMKRLAAGGLISVRYHTPQLLRQVLGEHSGVFELMLKDGKIVSQGAEELKRYIALLDAIEVANA